MTNHIRTNRSSRHLQAYLRISLVIALSMALLACGKDEQPAAGSTETPVVASTEVAPEVAPENAVSDKVTAMSAEQLRDAARDAYGENRLYAPAGDNAVEYYLALREKSPKDPAVSSALVDLLPMTVIATEQSVNREDFAEAQRLVALLDKADSGHPALARLKNSIDSKQKDAVARAERQVLTAEQETERKAELEAKRLAEQKAQQEAAARELASQQVAAQNTAAQQEAAAAAAAKQKAEEAATAKREADRRAAAQAAAQAAAKPTAADLRPLSTPAPAYPPDAFRNRTSGEVQVEFTVGVDGSVTNVRVVRSNPSRVFDREATDAVRRWRFQPLSAPVTTRRTIGFEPGG